MPELGGSGRFQRDVGATALHQRIAEPRVESARRLGDLSPPRFRRTRRELGRTHRHGERR